MPVTTDFPVAGSIYNWAKRMGTATVAWLGGWMMLTASIVTLAAVALLAVGLLGLVCLVFRHPSAKPSPSPSAAALAAPFAASPASSITFCPVSVVSPMIGLS